MTVATFTQTNYLTQNSSSYKANIDACNMVEKIVAGAFAPHQSNPTAMTITLDAGNMFTFNTASPSGGSTLVAQGTQVSGTITAPVSNPRIDRVTINGTTGALTVITGAEGASPSPPAITAGYLPICQIALAVGQSTIINANITDERCMTVVTLASASGIPQAGIANSAIGQAQLKQSIGSVNSTSLSLYNLTLPGGSYGFFPQIKGGSTVSAAMSTTTFSQSSYTTNIALSTGNGSYPAYAQQTYVTASGEDHWIFLLRDKATGNIMAGYEAPDHPSANTSALHTEMTHPFPDADLENQDIIIVDNVILDEVSSYINRTRNLLEIINTACTIDDSEDVEWVSREIHKINEWPDEPLGGEVLQAMAVPQFAKALIKSDTITIEKFTVDELPDGFLHRRLKFNASRLTDPGIKPIGIKPTPGVIAAKIS